MRYAIYHLETGHITAIVDSPGTPVPDHEALGAVRVAADIDAQTHYIRSGKAVVRATPEITASTGRLEVGVETVILKGALKGAYVMARGPSGVTFSAFNRGAARWTPLLSGTYQMTVIGAAIGGPWTFEACTADEALAADIDAIKRRASDLINEIAPVWRQLNDLASPDSPDAIARREKIDAIRAWSNAAEADRRALPGFVPDFQLKTE